MGIKAKMNAHTAIEAETMNAAARKSITSTWADIEDKSVAHCLRLYYPLIPTPNPRFGPGGHRTSKQNAKKIALSAIERPGITAHPDWDYDELLAIAIASLTDDELHRVRARASRRFWGFLD